MKPEARIQRNIRDLLVQVGFHVWDTSQGYRKDPGGTRMTPGLPDLVLSGHNHTLFVEVKTEKGKLTPHQQLFSHEWNLHGGTCLVWRSVEDAWDYLVGEGIIEETDDDA